MNTSATKKQCRENSFWNIQALEQNAISQRGFFDPASIARFLTREKIHKILVDCNISLPVTDVHSLVNYILTPNKPYLTFFAILLHMRCVESVCIFSLYRQRLDRLPLSLDALDEAGVFGGMRRPDVLRRHFLEVQHKFIPHVFSSTRPVEIIDTETVVPFLSQVPLGNSGVFRTEVSSSAHENLKPQPNKDGRTFLIRRIYPNQPEEKEESNIEELGKLKRLRELQNPNITPFFCAYIQGTEWNIMFNSVEDMNLEQLLNWDNKAPFGNFKHNFAFYSALHGLSSALKDAHGLVLTREDGYSHKYLRGDIRPANIFVNKDTFLLADFGFSTEVVGKGNSVCETYLISEDRGTDYQAPECNQAVPVTQSIDIWAFGCIFAEIATYIERGKEGVAEFRSKRFNETTSSGKKCQNQFFWLDDKKKMLKKSVLLHFEALSKAPRDKQTPEILELAKAMLQIDVKSRISAASFCERMFFLSVKSLFNAVLGKFRQPGAEKRTIETWGDVLGLTKPWSLASGARINALGMPCRQKLLQIFQGLHDKGKLPTREELIAICGFLTAGERARVPISAK
ncbi:kinase-like protein [Morchella conica CCBAS932]|uniref:Kinase-like protein n=1 Tax=Morchella conica CCBAS932 TaxID=1392247 RepID=A0A3N4L1R7_9PEZI|nr:kinase-like protein [Morchella conica CCBAS932]